MSRSLKLGIDALQLLLPQRRPLLLVDTLTRYAKEPRPSLRASRHVSANEEVFAGHLPGLHLWPGVYTIEGLAQSCQLLATLLAVDAEAARRGLPDGAVLDALARRERALRRGAGSTAPASAEEAALFEALAASRPLGLLAAVEVRLLAPVYAGCRVDYAVERARVDGDGAQALARFEVEAVVDGAQVARGALTVAAVAPPP